MRHHLAVSIAAATVVVAALAPPGGERGDCLQPRLADVRHGAAADGGVFTYGDAPYFGSIARPIGERIVAIAGHR